MYIADLHIHSKYSRATSRDGDPEHLEFWARRKGIDLLGTGDFTHPVWREELKERLEPAEDGFYTLRGDLRIADEILPEGRKPRFVVSGEISSIYKKNGRVRKVHNVILLPGLEAAEALAHKLEAIGNIYSDGRPILGLDSHDLLEITLETCPDAIFIPAHIWTPHFSLFGAFSGFDTIEECFEDLTPYIHALETGLSSDPPMNWRLSALDGYTLVSNSDAHSPQKLGREANLLDGEFSYAGLSRAIQTGDGFHGTIEFFPEEGKYHYDGHRNCGLCLSPTEAEQYAGKCPVCGRKLTIGVEHRVEQLADRPERFILPSARPFESIAPLPEVISASTAMGSATSGKVQRLYESMLHELGPEFMILREVPTGIIEEAAGPCVAEGIRRLRAGEVKRSPGFDGEYGTIQLLDPSEIALYNGQISLFGVNTPSAKSRKPHIAAPTPIVQFAKAETAEEIVPAPRENRAAAKLLAELNDEQREAVTAAEPSIAVVAGPGTGKTKTLVSRIVYLVEERGVKPGEITAVTFTNKAAGEMRERLEAELGLRKARALHIGTFHSLCLELLAGWQGDVVLADEYESLDLAGEVIRSLEWKGSPRSFLQEVSKRKNGLPSELPDDVHAAYCDRLREQGMVDFDDLLLDTLAKWDEHTEEGSRFRHLLVDEFQDSNSLQFQLITAWSRRGESLFVIGDPDQSIYGFRGSDARCFDRLAEERPGLRTIRLVKNYRSTPEIIGCALPVIAQNAGPERILDPQRESGPKVSVLTAESDLSEGICIAKEVNRMVGGIDMLDAESYRPHTEDGQPRSFSDIAILYRTHRQARLIEHCLRRESIPYVVAGRDDFLAEAEVRGTVAFFRFLCEPRDLPALRAGLKLLWNCPEDLVQGLSRVLERAAPELLTPELLREITAAYHDVGLLREWLRLAALFLPRLEEPPRRLLEDWSKTSGFSSEALGKLMNMSVFHSELPAFLQNLILGQESDLVRSSEDERPAAGKSYFAGAVTLMTLHGAKGLEFPVVFLAGVNRGTIPLESVTHPADLGEERRLFYVGMTRAREELLLLTSPNPSPFLADLPARLIRAENASGRRNTPEGVQLSLFG